MRRKALLFLLSATTLQVSAQKAVVEESLTDVVCYSPTSAIIHFKEVTTILNERGAGLANFVCSCSKNDELTGFKGQVSDAGGRVLRKFKERKPDIEACATCFFYPQCNRNRLVMCKRYNCTPEYRQERLYETTEGMKYEYERYKML
jgi:hypothetical protein